MCIIRAGFPSLRLRPRLPPPVLSYAQFYPLSGVIGQQGAKPKLRMICICAAMYLSGRGLESARVHARMERVRYVRSFREHYLLGGYSDSPNSFSRKLAE